MVSQGPSVRSASWEDMLDRHPALAREALYMVGDHVREAHARIRELSTEDVGRRMAHTLLRLTAQAGRRTEQGILIDFPLSRQDVAEMIGATRYKVSLILSEWTDDGLVDGGRQRIVVREPQKLLELARG